MGKKFTFLSKRRSIKQIEEGVYLSPKFNKDGLIPVVTTCLLYTSPSPRDATLSRMPSSA